MKKKLAILLTTAAVAGGLISGLTASAQNTTPPGAPPSSTPSKPAPRKGGERHPALRRAIVALQEAKADLERANHDFGGHRVQAVKDVDAAIVQLKLALEYDRK